MVYKEIVDKWTSFAGLEANLKEKLGELQASEKLVEDSFYKHL
jgi:phosphoglucomutase